jgi:single-stranded DNA-binding protein
MNSFTLNVVGNFANDPQVSETGRTRFCLIGNDCAGSDGDGKPREVVTSMWFSAFNGVGAALAKGRKGDQVTLTAYVRNNNWTDKEGNKRFDHSYVVESFRWGMPGKIKREEWAAGQSYESQDRGLGDFDGEVPY